MAWQPHKTTIALIAGVAVVVMVAGVVGGLHCARSCGPAPAVVEGIDAGPGEQTIAASVRDAEAQAARQLLELEREHREAIEQFDEEQREQYEAVRKQGPDAVADWMDEWLRARRP